MKILALETSGKICSVALLENEEVRSEYNLNLGLRHSEFLFPLIDRILKESGWQLNDLEGIAVDKGPGSFTGIRIGLISARTLAQLLNIPLVGVISLDVLVDNISPSNCLVSPIINALGEEVYTSLYQFRRGKWQRLVTHQIVEIDSWLNHLLTFKKTIFFIGDATLIYEKKIKTKFRNYSVSFSSLDNLYPLARNVGHLGRKKLLRGKDNFQAVLPLYLRRSYAEINYGKTGRGRHYYSSAYF